MRVPTPPLAIEMLRVGTLKPDPKNPRRHTPQQVGQIARSIQSFGFNVPLVVDGDNKLAAGHGRLLAAQKLGLETVPVIRLTHLTPAQARAFAIADNRLTENAGWDERLLAEIFRDLAALDLDFSLEVTGFSMAEIDIRIEAIDDDKSASSSESVPPIGASAVTKIGDLWQLGRHLIYCGDALSPASYNSLMKNTHADMIFSDPPYNKKIQGDVSGNGAIQHREFVMATGEMSHEEFVRFLTTSCKLMARYSTDGAIHYLCMDWAHAEHILAAGREAYSELKNICVWVKNNGGMGSLYRSRHELVFVFKNGAGKHRNNVELGRHGRNRTNVWEYPGIHTFGRGGEEGNLLALHPTVKPVRMIADAMLDCSARGDIVLDPFLGSGSTLIAAERTGRKCHAIEFDPLYVDVAIRRWQTYTGEKAVHAETGRHFEPEE